MKAAQKLFRLFFRFGGSTWQFGDSSRNYGFNPSPIFRGIIGSKRTPITSASNLRRFKFPCQQPPVARTQRAAAPRAKLHTRSKHQTGNNSLSDSVCQVAESTLPLEKSLLALQSCQGQEGKQIQHIQYVTTVNKWVCFCLQNIPWAANSGQIWSSNSGCNLTCNQSSTIKYMECCKLTKFIIL